MYVVKDKKDENTKQHWKLEVKLLQISERTFADKNDDQWLTLILLPKT